MATPVGAESIAVFAELPFIDGREDLRYGLLDETVNNGRDTQQAFLSAVFGYFHAPYRIRPVLACADGMQEFSFMLMEPSQQICRIHAVYAATVFVCNHPLIGFVQIGG